MLPFRHIPAHCLVQTLLLGLTACGASSGLSADLDERAFLLESSQGFQPVAGTKPYLRFDAGDLFISADCNSGSGAYRIRDGRVLVDGLALTERGCDSARQDQDEWLVAFITSRPTVVLDGNRLTLTGASATLVFLDREQANPDRPLQESVWSVDSFINDDAVSNLPLTTPPVLLFRADGTLQIDTTCNTGSGTYQVSREQLTLSNVSYTDKACSGASAVANDQLQKVLGNGSIEFEIEAARLTLMRGKLGVGATAP